MNNFIKNNLVYLLAFATIIFAVTVIFIGIKTPSNAPTEPIKRFEASSKPTAEIPEIIVISTNVHGQLFQVIDPVIVNFSQPISTDSIKVEITPQKAIKKTQMGSTAIVLEPEEIWDFDTIYNITLEFSKKSYKFSFQTEQHKGI